MVPDARQHYQQALAKTVPGQTKLQRRRVSRKWRERTLTPPGLSKSTALASLASAARAAAPASTPAAAAGVSAPALSPPGGAPAVQAAPAGSSGAPAAHGRRRPDRVLRRRPRVPLRAAPWATTIDLTMLQFSSSSSGAQHGHFHVSRSNVPFVCVSRFASTSCFQQRAECAAWRTSRRSFLAGAWP